MRFHNQRPEDWCPEKGEEWYSRGYFPHRDNDKLTQSISFRLADTLPQVCMDWLKRRLEVLEDELHQAGDDGDTIQIKILRERFCHIERFLDAGYGECLLRRSDLAEIKSDALNYFDETRYELICWCIMPNHVHAVIKLREGQKLKQILHSWKSYTAKKINANLNRKGTVWAREYHDRFIRDDAHMAKVIDYVKNNPVKAGLAKTPDEWRWSSAFR